MNARDEWKRDLQRTGECVPVERFEALAAADRAHIGQCARCEAEIALWKEFQEGVTSAEDAPAVEAITRALRPSSAQAVDLTTRRRGSRLQWMALAATLVIAVGIGYFVQNREPSVNVAIGRNDLYRSARVEVVSPTGDLAAAPVALEWRAAKGATSYDVQVMEVDRAMLWRASTSGSRIEIPPAVSAQCVPGKTILWEVVARRGGEVIAASGTQKFRVR